MALYNKRIWEVIKDKVAEEIAAGVAALKAEKGVTPGLAVILVGDNPASVSYVTAKEKACAEAGMYSKEIRFGEGASRPLCTEEELLATIRDLNAEIRIRKISDTRCRIRHMGVPFR